MSEDNGVTFRKISYDKLPMGAQPGRIEGDMQVYGRVFVPTGGRGIYYGEIARINDKKANFHRVYSYQPNISVVATQAGGGSWLVSPADVTHFYRSGQMISGDTTKQGELIYRTNGEIEGFSFNAQYFQGDVLDANGRSDYKVYISADNINYTELSEVSGASLGYTLQFPVAGGGFTSIKYISNGKIPQGIKYLKIVYPLLAVNDGNAFVGNVDIFHTGLEDIISETAELTESTRDFVKINFKTPLLNVTASDFNINGAAASSISADGAVYTIYPQHKFNYNKNYTLVLSSSVHNIDGAIPQVREFTFKLQSGLADLEDDCSDFSKLYDYQKNMTCQASISNGGYMPSPDGASYLFRTGQTVPDDIENRGYLIYKIEPKAEDFSLDFVYYLGSVMGGSDPNRYYDFKLYTSPDNVNYTQIMAGGDGFTRTYPDGGINGFAFIRLSKSLGYEMPDDAVYFKIEYPVNNSNNAGMAVTNIKFKYDPAKIPFTAKLGKVNTSDNSITLKFSNPLSMETYRSDAFSLFNPSYIEPSNIVFSENDTVCKLYFENGPEINKNYDIYIQPYLTDIYNNEIETYSVKFGLSDALVSSASFLLDGGQSAIIGKGEISARVTLSNITASSKEFDVIMAVYDISTNKLIGIKTVRKTVSANGTVEFDMKLTNSESDNASVKILAFNEFNNIKPVSMAIVR